MEDAHYAIRPTIGRILSRSRSCTEQWLRVDSAGRAKMVICRLRGETPVDHDGMSDGRSWPARRAVVGVSVPFPLALFVRHWLNLPDVNSSLGEKGLAVTYWLPWTSSWLAVNLVGVALILWPGTRRAGRWFLVASVVTSTPISWFYFGLEYHPLWPN